MCLWKEILLQAIKGAVKQSCRLAGLWHTELLIVVGYVRHIVVSGPTEGLYTGAVKQSCNNCNNGHSQDSSLGVLMREVAENFT